MLKRPRGVVPTGSQELYVKRPQKVADNSRASRAHLDEWRWRSRCVWLWKPALTIAEAILNVCPVASASPRALASSPWINLLAAKMWIPAHPAGPPSPTSTPSTPRAAL